MALQVEQFWHLYSYLARSNDLQGPCDYLMFRQGIRPMWEVSQCFGNEDKKNASKLAHDTVISFLPPLGGKNPFATVHQ